MTENHQDTAEARRAKGSRYEKAAGRRRRQIWIASVVAALAVVVSIGALLQEDASAVEFTDVVAQTSEFMGYYETIELTAEQELVKRQALSAIPAPCCSDNSAYTCCCPCNMAKTWWGLSHHLIADEGYGAEEVRAAVEGWIDFINPQGFSGDACYKGGCGRPFDRNGCGGMDERSVVF